MLITLEGPEGAGKSTLIRSLDQALGNRGFTVFSTREPGAGPVGSAIRSILLEGDALSSRAELLLFLADRAQHVESMVRPALERGDVVLCDRYSDSTIVYQGYGRGLPLDQLRNWCSWSADGLQPDLTILLDLDPTIGLQRLSHPDRLDREPIEFHRRIRNGFLSEANREPKRFTIVDAIQSPEKVLELSLNRVLDQLTASGIRSV